MYTRLPSALFICACSISLCGAAAPAAAADVSGSIVDTTGRPVPRAYVRAVDGSARELAAAFADESGRFALTVSAADCRIEASLTGFTTSSAACGDAQPLRITLRVAPIEETIVVSATRTEAPASQVGASVTTFSAADLEDRRVTLVADLLRTTPGATVIGTGAPGGVTSLFVRGGESSYNKVLLDGIPLNEPGGTFNFSSLTTDNLERVEIVRGAQSALFGSDAMSSVVQLITKRAAPGAKPTGSATIEGGTYSTVHGGGDVSGTVARLDYSFGASGFDTDNQEPNSAFRDTTISGAAGVRLGSDASLRFVGRGQLQRTGTPGQTAFGRPDLDAFFKRNDGAGGVTFDGRLTSSIRQRAIYSLTVSHQQSTNLVADPPYTPEFEGRRAPFEFADFLFDSLNELRRHHASYQADIQLANDASRGAQLLTAIVDWDGERATLKDRLASTSTPASRDNVGFALQHQAVWRRVTVTAGGRFDHNDSFGNAAVPRVSAVFVPHASSGGGFFGDTRVRAAAGLGVKEPTLLQSFSPSPFFRGNPDLLPERSRSVEAGIEQRFASDRARVEATWFDNLYRNLISTRTTNPSTFAAEYFNIGRTRARGAELSGDVRPLGPLHVRAGYTFLASEILESTSPSSPVLVAGQSLFRRPRHSGFAGAGWTDGRVSVDLSGVFVGSFVDSDFSSLEPPILEHAGYTTWALRGSYVVARNVSVLLAIDNLTGTDYMEPLGYPALGRAVRGGLRVAF